MQSRIRYQQVLHSSLLFQQLFLINFVIRPHFIFKEQFDVFRVIGFFNSLMCLVLLGCFSCVCFREMDLFKTL